MLSLPAGSPAHLRRGNPPEVGKPVEVSDLSTPTSQPWIVE